MLPTLSIGHRDIFFSAAKHTRSYNNLSVERSLTEALSGCQLEMTVGNFTESKIDLEAARIILVSFHPCYLEKRASRSSQPLEHIDGKPIFQGNYYKPSP